MQYTSTRTNELFVTPPQAVVMGLADDGGLFMPSEIEHITENGSELITMSEHEIYLRVLTSFFPCLSNDEMSSLIQRAYANKFPSENRTPLKKVKDKYILELFHGPTCAFKDVALSFLPLLIAKCKEQLGDSSKILILTATSGDTGSAALNGFGDIEGIHIGVFYPYGGVSTVQEAQMTVNSCKNAFVCAIHGDFDDAQSGVKAAFRNNTLKSLFNLSSANSINIGRLAPQVCYYFTAYAQLLKEERITAGENVDFVVPTGNFGDILAGYFAKLMGLPVGELVCASNANNVLTDFFNSGVYDTRRRFIKTISPSMDILISSNLERLLFLMYNRDTDKVKRCMYSLANDGIYDIGSDMLEKLRQSFSAYYCKDSAALNFIGNLYKETGYLMDTHTATAWAASEQRESKNATVVLSTASPYKFADNVLRAIGTPSQYTGFDAIDALHAATNIPIPANLDALRRKKRVHSDVICKEDMIEYIIKKAGALQ